MATKKNEYLPQIAFHPGDTLAEKLKEIDMSQKEFAVRTGKPEKTITAILNHESSITPEMAVKFEHVLQIPAHFWLNMQLNYNEFVARQKRLELLNESTAWAAKFPFAAMINAGWLNAQSTLIDKTAELLSFFGFSDARAWEKYYFEQQLKVAFRISLAHTKEHFALSAWLRKGELQAAKITTKNYNEKLFRESLYQIKSLMAKHPVDFFTQLQEICSACGVCVVFTPYLPKAPISGATRWLSRNKPLIQLSGRYKRNDIFWFTFFHEAGHILLHGRKDIFMEDVDYTEKDLAKEKEADDFAVKWTFSVEQQEKLLLKNSFTEAEILEYANEFNTHPAIIIGRLQHLKLIPYSVGTKFFIPVYLQK
jgi:addiction module HigA family antidote